MNGFLKTSLLLALLLSREAISGVEMTSCEHATRGVLRFSGTVLVHGSVASRLGLRNHPEEAVSRLLRYVDGDIHFGELSNSKSRVVLLNRQSFRVLGIQDTRYGRDVAVEGTDGLPSTKVSRSDPALSIRFEAERDVATCGIEHYSSGVTLHLPYDPYFAYDWVPSRQMRSIEFQHQVRKTNPCADAESVLIDSPEMYWYTWNPHASGKDADGKKYDCRDILREGRDYQSLSASLLEKQERKSEAAWARELESLRAGIIFGFVSGESADRTFADSKKFFSDHLPDLRSFDEQRLATLLNSSKRGSQDASTWAVVDFLSKLFKVAQIASLDLQAEGESLTLRVQGKLRKTGKNLELALFVGSTEPGARAAQEFLLSQMAGSQLLFFIGHAMTGKSLDWTPLKERFPRTQKKQLIGLVSCFAPAYETTTYEDFRSSQGLETALLLTDFRTYRYLLPIGVLNFIDQKPGAEGVPLGRELSDFLEPGETALLLSP